MLLEASGIAASVNPRTLAPHQEAHGVTESQRAKKRMRTLAHSRAPRSQNIGRCIPPLLTTATLLAAIVITSVSTPVRSRPTSPKAT